MSNDAQIDMKIKELEGEFGEEETTLSDLYLAESLMYRLWKQLTENLLKHRSNSADSLIKVINDTENGSASIASNT